MSIYKKAQKSLATKLALGAALLTLVACETTVQTTSGADYLERSASSPNADAYASYSSPAGLNEEILEIAAIEPDLRFPARIGLARLDRSTLISVPMEEGYIWSDAISGMSGEFGEFVPVNPLIASTVAAAPSGKYRYSQAEALSNIRRGAARQHLDYVLIYDAHSAKDVKANGLSFADLSVIGLFVLPSRTVDVKASASGILMDVRTGYPYATLTHFADDQAISTMNHASDRGEDLSDKAELAAIEGLAGEAQAVFGKLYQASMGE